MSVFWRARPGSDALKSAAVLQAYPRVSSLTGCLPPFLLSVFGLRRLRESLLRALLPWGFLLAAIGRLGGKPGDLGPDRPELLRQAALSASAASW